MARLKNYNFSLKEFIRLSNEIDSYKNHIEQLCKRNNIEYNGDIIENIRSLSSTRDFYDSLQIYNKYSNNLNQIVELLKTYDKNKNIDWILNPVYAI